jgi:transglutaminase/protease-like cytokinesis protein 3
MKFIKNTLITVAVVIFLINALIFVCYVNPDLTVSIGKFLYQDQAVKVATINNIDVSQTTLEFANGLKKDNQIQNKQDDVSSKEASYQVPEVEKQQIEESVAGRTGYSPVQDQSELITQQETDNIENQVNYGDTGKGLEFDEVTYPYYAMLSDNQKGIYRQVYANTMALNAVFTPETDVTQNELKDAVMALSNDHPELFWLDTSYLCKMTQMGNIVEITLQFNSTANDLESEKALFDSKANEILAGAKNLESNYQKEVYVHDSLMNSINYNLNSTMNQSAYSALVSGQTVCAGYAKAFQYLMQQLGIPCYYCTGYSGEDHAWNIIDLDDGYYNVDVTWDDTDPNTHDYFNKTDAAFSNDHIRTEMSVNLPACSQE